MSWMFNPCLPCCNPATCIISVTGRLVDGDSGTPLTSVNPRLDVFSLSQNKWVLMGFFPGTLDANKKFTLRFLVAHGFRSYADSTRRFKFRIVSTMPCPYLPVSPKVFDASCGDTLDVGDLAAYKMTAPNLALDFTYLASVDGVMRPKTFTYTMSEITSGFGAGTWVVTHQYTEIDKIVPPGLPLTERYITEDATPPAGWEYAFDPPYPYRTILIFDYTCPYAVLFLCDLYSGHTFVFACGTSGFTLSHSMSAAISLDSDGNPFTNQGSNTCTALVNYPAVGAGSSSAPDAAANFTARPFRMEVDLTPQVGRFSGQACDNSDPLTITDLKLVLHEV